MTYGALYFACVRTENAPAPILVIIITEAALAQCPHKPCSRSPKGYPLQNCRIGKVLACAGGECDRLSVVAVTWE